MSQSYEVSHAELTRVARLPAEERGNSISVVQQTRFADDVSEGEGMDVSCNWGRRSTRTLAAPLGTRQHLVRARTPTPASDSHAKERENSAAAAVAVAAVVAVVAGTAAVSLAVMEGSRYDGWVASVPSQPVLLVDERGNHDWMRLDEIEPDDLEGVTHGVLLDVTGGLTQLGRRPLNRRGFMYQFELGTAQVASSLDSADWGWAGRLALGYMPVQRFGLSLGAAASTLDTRRDTFAEGEPELSVESRLFVQAELWPLALGRFHAGAYTELGWGWALRDEPQGSRSTEGPALSAGLALQLEWTTRLALTLRAGLASVPELDNGVDAASEGRRLSPELTLGLGIY